MALTSTSKAFPGFSHVFEFHGAESPRVFRGKMFLPDAEDPLAIMRAEQKPSKRVEVRWMMGSKKPSDIIYTTYVAPVLVSDRVVGILRSNGFSGWETYPVDVYDKAGQPIPGYHGLAVHGRCGPIDDSQSVQFYERMPARISPRWRGLYFDPTTWDGSDFFMPAGGGFKFVVEAVKNAFEKAKVKVVSFTPLDMVERMVLSRGLS